MRYFLYILFYFFVIDTYSQDFHIEMKMDSISYFNEYKNDSILKKEIYFLNTVGWITYETKYENQKIFFYNFSYRELNQRNFIKIEKYYFHKQIKRFLKRIKKDL